MNFLERIKILIDEKIKIRIELSKIINNIGWLFFDKFLRMGFGIFVGIWVARYLGPEKFGLLSFSLAFVGLFMAVASLGLQEIVVRNLVQYPNQTNEILGTAAIMQAASGLAAYVLIIFGIFFLRPESQITIYVVSILGLMAVYKFSDISIYWFESKIKSKYIVWIQNIGFIVSAILKIILILNNASLEAFIWVIFIESVVVSTLIMVMLLVQGPSFKDMKYSKVLAINLLKDSWPIIFTIVAISIYMKIDQIMIGEMLGDEYVGVYSAAIRISEVWYFMPMIIAASVFPTIIQTRKANEKLYYERLQRLYSLMVWVSIPIALPMTFLATPLIVALYGEAYAEAGLVLAIHIWATVFVALGVASGKWFIAENRQIMLLQRTFIGMLVNIVLNILLIPIYGIVGAAIATVISQFCVGMLCDAFQKETKKMFQMKLAAFNPRIIKLSELLR